MRRERSANSATLHLMLISLLWLGALVVLGSGCRNVSGGGPQRQAPEDPDLSWERTEEDLAEVERPLAERPPPLEPELAETYPPDNTGINQRDRQAGARTPMDQGNDDQALQITAQIRKRVIAADGLSFTAKNIKIISADGLITLKGPVASPEERDRILEIARRVAGDWRIENRIDVVEG